MSKNKFKNSPKKLLMETTGLDAEATTVLMQQLHLRQMVLSCEDNVLYITANNGIKTLANQTPGFIGIVNELKYFIEMKSDQSVLYYLYEKIKTLENKIDSLERENENLNDKLREIDGKIGSYHD